MFWRTRLIHQWYQYDYICDKTYTNFCEYASLFNSFCDECYINGALVTVEEIVNHNNVIKRFDKFKFLLGNVETIYSHLPSFSSKKKILNEFTLINLINFYCLYKNCFINNEGIFYLKIGTFFSLYKEDEKSNLINKVENMFLVLLADFALHLRFVDLTTLKINYFFKLENLIKESDQFFINQININPFLFEFSDGVYISDYNKFISKDFFIKNNINFKTSKQGTLKNYNLTYHNLKKPVNWLNYVKQFLKEDIEIFSLIIGSFLVAKIKTTDEVRICCLYNTNVDVNLILKPIKNLFLNCYVEITNKTFDSKNLYDKSIIIFNKFDDYKIINNFLYDNLYNDSEKYKKNFLIISNSEFENTSFFNINDVFIKRFHFNSNKTPLAQCKSLKETIINEEPNILVYCIGKFFTKNVYKKYIYINNKKIKITTRIKDDFFISYFKQN